MEYFNDFRFGEKSLSDFGGVIYNKDGIKTIVGMTPNHITLEIPNKGEIYYGTQYGARSFDIDVFFDEDVDVDELVKWICVGGEKEFQYEGSERYIKAVYNGQLDFSVFFQGEDMSKSLVTIPFIAHDPFWRIIRERSREIDNPILNNIHLIKGKNNIDSYPVIKIKPKTNGSVRFKWNGDIIILKDLVSTRTYTIDSENGEFYYMQSGSKIPCMNLYESTEYYDMPIVKPFINNELVVIEGQVEKIEVNCNSRIL